MRTRTRRILGLLFLVLVIAAGAIFGLWQWSRSAPEWYRPPDPADEDVAAFAERIEYRLTQETQRIRPLDEEWTVRVREEQANAWLATRLSDWMAHEHGRPWPEELGPPQVHLQDGRMSIALDAGPHAGGRVITARIIPQMTGEQLTFQLEGLDVGRVPVPGNPARRLTELARDLMPADSPQAATMREIMDILTGRTPIDPVVDLADGRRVRLRRIATAGGCLDLTSVTLAGDE